MKKKMHQKTLTKRPERVVAAATSGRNDYGCFPVVGLGASAGGLEALEQFLGSVPANSGMAFVIIQHLDPTHQGILPELLQRGTPMKVIQAKDRLKVLQDHVYIIPPNKDMSILHGVLHLFAPAERRGLRLPIDFFFRSLAIDCQGSAVAVILSGMGSDGTIGLRAVKENAGLVLVQEPLNAKCDGMPRSAIATGLADFVAPVQKLPEQILAYFNHVSLLTSKGAAGDEVAASTLEKIIILLRNHTGHDFSLYKRNTLYRRIERRMGIHQINRINAYVRYLQENQQELEILFKELLIGVTGFFRDPAAWERLRGIIEELLTAGRYTERRTVRAWTIGCSTGEEAYSLAIVFREAMEMLSPKSRVSLQIFATDIQKDAIDKARQGVYPTSITANVSPARLARFFIKDDGGYRICKEIRETIVFAPQNVIMDPPFARLDMVVCRNLLIYLTGELQKKLISLFHYCLNPGGLLFLGSSESIGGSTDLFKSIDVKARIFERGLCLNSDGLDFPSSFVRSRQGVLGEHGAVKSLNGIGPLIEQMIMQQYAPAAVLVNKEGDIVYVSGRTGKYLEPAAGKANMNIFVMAREGIRHELPHAFQKANRLKTPVILNDLIVSADGGKQYINLTVQAITEPPELQGMVVLVFSDVCITKDGGNVGRKQSASSRGGHGIDQELVLAREELHVVREEMRTAREELTSANEELQSSNEELQSTNEELTTSKEEMQSLNEELQTVNAELQAKVEELSHTNSDMKNLLNSTDIATVFLDNELKVRRFTAQAAKIIKLIPGDVGRPVDDLSSLLLYPELLDDAREVLRTLVFTEKKVRTKIGEWYLVRIMPYRTLENIIDGVVITFADFTRFIGQPSPRESSPG
jgi:two-component system CheB/CheR fusion protein